MAWLLSQNAPDTRAKQHNWQHASDGKCDGCFSKAVSPWGVVSLLLCECVRPRRVVSLILGEGVSPWGVVSLVLGECLARCCSGLTSSVPCCTSCPSNVSWSECVIYRLSQFIFLLAFWEDAELRVLALVPVLALPWIDVLGKSLRLLNSDVVKMGPTLCVCGKGK